MEMAAMHHLFFEIVLVILEYPLQNALTGEKSECLPGVPGIVSEKSHDFHDGKDVWRCL